MEKMNTIDAYDSFLKSLTVKDIHYPTFKTTSEALLWHAAYPNDGSIIKFRQTFKVTYNEKLDQYDYHVRMASTDLLYGLYFPRPVMNLKIRCLAKCILELQQDQIVQIDGFIYFERPIPLSTNGLFLAENQKLIISYKLNNPRFDENVVKCTIITGIITDNEKNAQFARDIVPSLNYDDFLKNIFQPRPTPKEKEWDIVRDPHRHLKSVVDQVKADLLKYNKTSITYEFSWSFNTSPRGKIEITFFTLPFEAVLLYSYDIGNDFATHIYPLNKHYNNGLLETIMIYTKWTYELKLKN